MLRWVNTGPLSFITILGTSPRRPSSSGSVRAFTLPLCTLCLLFIYFYYFVLVLYVGDQIAAIIRKSIYLVLEAKF